MPQQNTDPSPAPTSVPSLVNATVAAAAAEPRGWQVWWPRRIGWRLALGFGVLVTQRFASGDMQRLLRVQALSLQIEGWATP